MLAGWVVAGEAGDKGSDDCRGRFRGSAPWGGRSLGVISWGTSAGHHASDHRGFTGGNAELPIQQFLSPKNLVESALECNKERRHVPSFFDASRSLGRLGPTSERLDPHIYRSDSR